MEKKTTKKKVLTVVMAIAIPILIAIAIALPAGYIYWSQFVPWNLQFRQWIMVGMWTIAFGFISFYAMFFAYEFTKIVFPILQIKITCEKETKLVKGVGKVMLILGIVTILGSLIIFGLRPVAILPGIGMIVFSHFARKCYRDVIVPVWDEAQGLPESES